MSERKYGFFNIEEKTLKDEFEEFKLYCFKELQDYKEELRVLRRKIDDVEGQVM